MTERSGERARRHGLGLRVAVAAIAAMALASPAPAQQRYIASYYSNRLQGRMMSSGQRYHKDSLTCANNNFPLGTLIKVTDIQTGRSVVVRVMDRCGARRIDLSYAAAKELGIIQRGTARVEAQVYDPGEEAGTDGDAGGAQPRNGD